MDQHPPDELSTIDPAWRRYGEALLHSMAEVRADVADDAHPILMETADYWLALGLSIGISQPEQGARLLRLVEEEDPERSELLEDAKHFLAEVFP